MRDRSKETSNALVEVRTVLSRAQTALDTVRRCSESYRDPEDVGYQPAEGETWEEFLERAYIYYEDEDKAEMIAALEQVTELLSPWQGKRRRR